MKITLTNRAILYLRSVLEAPGWAKSHSDIYRAGELLCVVLPECTDAPELTVVKNELSTSVQPVDKKAFEEWNAKEVELEITSKQEVVIKSALTSLADKLNPGKATYELFLKFGLSE